MKDKIKRSDLVWVYSNDVLHEGRVMDVDYVLETADIKTRDGKYFVRPFHKIHREKPDDA